MNVIPFILTVILVLLVTKLPYLSISLPVKTAGCPSVIEIEFTSNTTVAFSIMKDSLSSALL